MQAKKILFIFKVIRLLAIVILFLLFYFTHQLSYLYFSIPFILESLTRIILTNNKKTKFYR
ncbi:hypothetical protein COM24_30430 [Bacillus toyonensis]|nr:hypothetical protein CON98_23310 [Bacillus toyonensis]PEO74101.1 hypothetical protein CN570_28060 [Bacillus toyonensis]PGC45467.1 hypothetical protein COM24_30430 [Bacillus toyonensis]PHG29875.1 hypothetical protein COI60_25910 [Bacillus toyonensis]SFM25360.1 hypothetical protein SAMN04488573_1155 [Bacillus sp. 5mfcol3.1]